MAGVAKGLVKIVGQGARQAATALRDAALDRASAAGRQTARSAKQVGQDAHVAHRARQTMSRLHTAPLAGAAPLAEDGVGAVNPYLARLDYIPAKFPAVCDCTPDKRPPRSLTHKSHRLYVCHGCGSKLTKSDLKTLMEARRFLRGFKVKARKPAGSKSSSKSSSTSSSKSSSKQANMAGGRRITRRRTRKN
jgi:hypothetical protein